MEKSFLIVMINIARADQLRLDSLCDDVSNLHLVRQNRTCSGFRGGQCGEKGRITSQDDLSPDFAKLCCQCTPAMCGHMWVANLTFFHTLSPSAKAVGRLLFDRLRTLFRAHQWDLFDQLGAVSVS
jgi:hypothetical protein